MTAARLAWLDAARGLAVVAMVAFHLIWDLGNFGYVDADLPFSTGVKLFGHAIAESFLFVAGVALVLAHERNATWRPFWRRIGVVAGAAGLVSLGTYLVFPQAFVFFGILHCIALSSLLAAPLLGHRWPLALVAAVLAALAPLVLSHPFFNPVWLTWIGLSTIEPLTYDYRPLAPWSGAVFAGVAAARFWRERGGFPLGARMRPGALSWLGRHALAIYLLHQPALFGVFSGLALLGGAPRDAGVDAFVVACAAQCEQSGAPAAICQKACRCTAEEAARGGSPTELASERAGRINDVARLCFARTQ